MEHSTVFVDRLISAKCRKPEIVIDGLSPEFSN